MTINTENLEKDIRAIAERKDQDSFIFDLLLAYGLPKASIARLKDGNRDQSKSENAILWKKKLYFVSEMQADLHATIDSAMKEPSVVKNQPRFIIATDFKTILSIDTRTNDSLDIPLKDLAKHYDFFLPWAGLEKSKIHGDNPADIKAAEKMGRLYDLILEDNPTENDEQKHALNVFLSRLLFCFFAEDTKIFDRGLFTNTLASQTSEDGSDLQSFLKRLFKVLNTETRNNIPRFLEEFPYVNGGLFAQEHPIPKFSAKSRKIIIECGSLNWGAINPDIFGSMIQAVVHTSQRGTLGMHYTSVANIMKVIRPLFLDDLYLEFENAGESTKKLEILLERIYNIKIFDPACGSGNFLIISYKELCKLEIEILKKLSKGRRSLRLSENIRLSQFYGIEIDDFAHETAKLSLWLAEHQMNLAFEEVFTSVRATLPLQEGGNIVKGNATQLEWNTICPKDDNCEIYLVGNPPYVGSKNQTDTHKLEMKSVLKGIIETNSLDYIACWFIKAAYYVDEKCSFSFVSTNSLFQGTQVPLLWPKVLSQELEIFFCHKDFLWTNNAKNKAGVTCSIVGVRRISSKDKYIYCGVSKRKVSNISPYLTEGRTVFVFNRNEPISKLPRIQIGNEPYDGGNLIFEDDEKIKFSNLYPEAKKYFKKLIGSSELINGRYRWCLWIENQDLKNALSIPGVKEIVDKVYISRKNGGMNARSCIDRSHQFRWVNRAKEIQIVLPVVSSERRHYIPTAFVDKETIVTNLAQVIYDPKPFVFAVINSRIHMVWVRTLAGRLKTDYRYSAGICYNTFPFPDISDSQKEMLEKCVFRVLEEREKHSEKTLADLYDPDKMPQGLLAAHSQMDLSIEQCYRKQPFTSDEERLEYLFRMYEEMIATEKKEMV